MKILIFALICLFTSPAIAQDFAAPLQTKPSPVLVELFSSQNCPACPPADAFLGKLVKSQGVIALSCHVDYFGKTSANLGKGFCTDRQTDYIEQINRKSHYTPQMMVNGHMNVIGYETQKVAAKIIQGRSERVSDIPITQKADGVYDFTLPKTSLNAPAKLWMAVYQNPKQVKERGKVATYHNVMSHYIPMGNWGGSAAERAVFPIKDNNSKGFVIIAQDSVSGKLLAAGDYQF